MPRLTRKTIKASATTDVVVGKDDQGQDITVTIRALPPEDFMDLLPDQSLDSADELSTKDALRLMRGENGKPGLIKELMVKACVEPKVSHEPQAADSEVLHTSEMSKYSLTLFREIMRVSGFGKEGAAVFRPEPTVADGGASGQGVRTPAK